MLSRHHGDGKAKEAEPEGHMVCPWAMSPLLGNPVLMECSICSGPYITYSSEEAWQPRQRTQAMDLYYHGESDPDYGCTSDTSKSSLQDLHFHLRTDYVTCHDHFLLPPPELKKTICLL
ncbi:serine/threonine-protein kinase Sgk1 isoform X1 [Tachysurus ichikawai]